MVSSVALFLDVKLVDNDSLFYDLTKMIPIRHLYVHIPFCPHLCPYCSFHILPAQKKHAEIVVNHLITEYQSIVHDLIPKTIFLGGGTPTALSTEMLERLLSHFIPHNRETPIEVTSECNPSTLSSQKAEGLLCFGVNRLSIGAQSFDPMVLKTLGRTHSVQAIFQCVDRGRVAGFSNINLDLIFGIPGQTMASWKTTLVSALTLHPQHLSCYGLTYEEDTEFFHRHNRGELDRNPDLEQAMFDTADQLLTQAGFHHYEVSNYALPGYECRHNLAYWRGEDYYGIGPSAVSTVRGVRFSNSKFDGTHWQTHEREILTKKILASERMILGLRTREGVDENEFADQFGFSPYQHWNREIQSLAQNGLLNLKPRLHLTRRGWELADEVATYFV